MSFVDDAEKNILDPLNTPQKEAVLSSSSSLRVLAGAGSGKTRVLVHRIAWLINKMGLGPANIMAVTFTNKAAQEMRSRIQDMLGFEAGHMWVGTFHGLAHRVLRQFHQEANLNKNFQIIDSQDQLRLIKRLMKDQGINEEQCEAKTAQSFINRQKDEGLRADKVSQNRQEDKLLVAIYQLYQQHCEQSGLIDFAEILLRTYELWRDDKTVRDYFHQRFMHILVDEFQDTNTIQYKWLKVLDSGDTHFTIVGDDDQSIYGWRGAKIENIKRFDRDFRGGETVRLEQNYRSTSTILTAANSVIHNNSSRLGKSLWTESHQGEKISLYGAVNEIDEARFVCDRISKWLSSGGQYNDIALLYRSNAQSRILEQLLRQQGIPYKIYGGVPFYLRAEIKDTLSYLRLIVNIRDDQAFERVVNLPPRGIGEKTLMNIRSSARAEQTSLWEVVENQRCVVSTGKAKNGLQQFINMICTLASLCETLSLSELVEKTLDISGLLMYIKNQPGERTHLRVEIVLELVQACRQFEQDFMKSAQNEALKAKDILPHFLTEVVLDSGSHEVEERQDFVKLMTLHASKGLEFPLVFLVGLEDGLFPHQMNIYDEKALEEERRLCYVGITRAMQKLYMTFAQKRAFAGQNIKIRRPSRFIKEIPDNIVETINLSSTSPLNNKKIVVEKEDGMYSTGSRVKHSRFGVGTVVMSDRENTNRVQIRFDSAGIKWLSLDYAKLEEA
jgi:DNA helicase-2/ATP-dependent DNA helicase PcrA